MLLMGDRQLRFYQHDRLASIGVPGSSVRVMNAASTPVCQLGGPPFTENKLLAVDRATSVLASIQSSAINSVAYCAYGNNGTGPLPVSLGFNGEHREAFDVYLLGRGERGYSPSLKRFISADRTSIFLAGNLNAYAYTAGDPINYNDPSGNFREFLSSIFGIKNRTSTQADKALIEASAAYRAELGKGAELEKALNDAKIKDAEARHQKVAINERLPQARAERNRLYSELLKMDSSTIFISTNNGLREVHVNSQYLSTQQAYLATEQEIYSLENQWHQLDNQKSYTASAEAAIRQHPLAVQMTKANLDLVIWKYSEDVAIIRR